MSEAAFANPAARAAVLARPERAALEFHRRLPGYAPTPLIACDEAAEQLGLGALLVKVESARLGLPSFKVLGASWAIYRELQDRFGAELGADWGSFDELARRVRALRPLTLSAATDGNHGRAVAHVARLLGIGARVYVPRGTARERIDAIAGERASVEVVDGGYDDAVRRSARDAGPRSIVVSDTSWPGYTRIPSWVVDGYSTALYEIDDALAEPPDVVLVQMGVGALAAAVARHYRSGGARPRLIGVEPLDAACVLASMRAGRPVTLAGPQTSIMAGLNCGTPSEVAWPDVSTGIDEFIAIADERARAGMRLLARAGIVAGETGAAGVGGLLELLDAGDAGLPGARVLVLCTEGATDREAYRAIVG